MAEPTKGEFPVTMADGRKITLAFDVNAFIDIGDQLGMGVPDVIKALGDKDNPPGLKFQRAVMWGGLQKHHPEMTIRDAGEILVEASEAMQKSIDAAMPKGDEEAGDDTDEGPQKPRRGTGTKP